MPERETLEHLWLAADRAMYEAKRFSGDGVAAAKEPAHTMGSCPQAAS